MIDNIVFDLDGTLINTLEDLKNSVNFALDNNGFSQVTLEGIRLRVGNGVKRLVYACIPPETDEKIKEKCLSEFKEHYLIHSMDCTCPYDGIKEMLAQVKALGYKISVVTNKMQPAAEKIIKSFFGEVFDVIIGQVDGLPQKPNPDGVFCAIEKMGCKRENSVYVGDSDVDCLTAHNANIPIIGVTWGFRDKETLKANNAEMIIDNPKEIVKCLKVL